MGVVKNIYKDHFPVQHDNIGERVKVIYHYNTKEIDYGVIIRNDAEIPFETIIQLENGNIIRGTECQYYRMMTDNYM